MKNLPLPPASQLLALLVGLAVGVRTLITQSRTNETVIVDLPVNTKFITAFSAGSNPHYLIRPSRGPEIADDWTIVEVSRSGITKSKMVFRESRTE